MPSRWRLQSREVEGVEELERFRTLAPLFPGVLRGLLAKFPSQQEDPEWSRFNAGIVQQMAPVPPFAFLRRPPLTPNVYSDAYDAAVAAELKDVKRRLEAMGLSPYEMLREDWVGGPRLYDWRYLTSSNLVKHLFQLLFFSNEAGVRLSEVRRVVEWGGGYGSLARLLYRFQPEVDYVILDTPVMLAVQWLFLSTVLGPDRVILPGSEDQTVPSGSVHLENAGTYEGGGTPVDLFVSTFALSESPLPLIDRVESERWFGAKHLWLAYTPSNARFPQWKALEAAAVRSGAQLSTHPFRPVDRYAFR